MRENVAYMQKMLYLCALNPIGMKHISCFAILFCLLCALPLSANRDWVKMKAEADNSNAALDSGIKRKNQLKRFFAHEALEICPDADERTDIILDLCYKHGYNRQFMWDCVGKVIVQRLEKMTYGEI